MKYVAAIDQGTTSTRCIIFDRAGQPKAGAQQEHQQIYLHRPGLAGYTHGRTLCRTGRAGGSGPIPPKDRPAAVHLFLGPENPLGEEQRARLYRGWQKAVTRTFDWID